MENYVFAPPESAAKSSSSASNEQEPPIHEIRISSSGKIRNYVQYILNLFKAQMDRVVLVGRGDSITKAVTVAEIVKRRMIKDQQQQQQHQQHQQQPTKEPAPSAIQQETTIGSEDTTEEWTPANMPKLDDILVTKRLPTIRIELRCAI